MVAYTHLTSAQNAALAAYRAAELERLELDQQAIRDWQLPITPNMPVDQYMRLTNQGWRLT